MGLKWFVPGRRGERGRNGDGGARASRPQPEAMPETVCTYRAGIEYRETHPGTVRASQTCKIFLNHESGAPPSQFSNFNSFPQNKGCFTNQVEYGLRRLAAEWLWRCHSQKVSQLSAALMGMSGVGEKGKHEYTHLLWGFPNLQRSNGQMEWTALPL